MLNLIICCDGTWNTPDQMDDDLPAPTNVVKLYNALENNPAQRRYYHPGVGTDGTWLQRMAGGGTGAGLNENIMSAYGWLTQNYQPEARIWLFGFSRGSWTVRSLGGMIARCGLLDPVASKMDEKQRWAAIKDLFEIYKTPENEAKPVTATAQRAFFNVPQGAPTRHSVSIEFIGVWDTVGALGVPDDMALLNLLDNPDNYRFHDTSLSNIVKHARHAIAIDEKRQSFSPTLWSNETAHTDMKQIWFPGVHADVGGGYGQSALSDGALQWMMEEAQACELAFRTDTMAQLHPDYLGYLHDSVTGVFKSLKTRPRNVPCFTTQTSQLHSSALKRYHNPPLTQGSYWPTTVLAEGDNTTVTVFAREHWNATGLYLEAGKTFHFQAQGEWMDSDIPSGPAGCDNGKFQLSKLAHSVSSLLGKAETLYQKFTHNHTADFWYTKREEQYPWFALVGMVANDFPSGSQQDEKLPHEVFLIGDTTTFTPKASGYLYAFANDAWQTYHNNRGSVALTVTCK